MSQEQSPATNGGEEYRVVFDETGGYDCMTCGFAIVRQNGDIAAEIDLRHYGQKPCDYEGSGFVDAKERAEFAAHLICAAINASNASPGCPPPSASCEPDPELTACARSAPRGDFIYLLNAFERASQSDNPSLLDYARKRLTLLDYVSKLETVPSETPRKSMDIAFCPSCEKEWPRTTPSATPLFPPELHPATADLVRRFSVALAEKLHAAEKKYGYDDGWTDATWMEECQARLLEHVAKGDPRDVAAYCAFMWHHRWSTKAAPAARPEKFYSADGRDG